MKIKDLGKKKVHEVLEIPGTWTQGLMYSDKNHLSCEIDQATCGCLLGLLCLVHEDESTRYGMVGRLRERVDFFISWNDQPGRTQEEVRSLCKELDI